MQQLKVFVIHVRGAKEREQHIRNELSKFNIEFEFILDGNKEDITPHLLDRYFKAPFNYVGAAQSCSIKHIFAYQALVKSNAKYGLIFEDDIILKSNFNKVFADIIKEIEREKLSNFLVSLEKTNHAFIGKNEIVKGKILYARKQGRCAGAYLVDHNFVESFLRNIESHKCDCPIDWYHNFLAENKQISIYWVHPFIAEQGSHNGSMPSLIDNKKTGAFRKIIYSLQSFVKLVFAKK